MRVFSTFMFRSNENKSCISVVESFQLTNSRLKLSTLVSWSNEWSNKTNSYMRVGWSQQVRVCNKAY